ncbi:uncharacterized protein METZ01_LOCUS404535, partial [marine metagenome]
MTTPMTSSSTGSMSAINRVNVVSISSSKKSATLFNISCNAPVDSPTSTIFIATDGNAVLCLMQIDSACPSLTS